MCCINKVAVEEIKDLPWQQYTFYQHTWSVTVCVPDRPWWETAQPGDPPPVSPRWVELQPLRRAEELKTDPEETGRQRQVERRHWRSGKTHPRTEEAGGERCWRGWDKDTGKFFCLPRLYRSALYPIYSCPDKALNKQVVTRSPSGRMWTHWCHTLIKLEWET